VSSRRLVASGVSVLAVGGVASQGLSVVRNIIIAHSVAPDQIGIAAAVMVTVSFLEMVGDASPNWLLVQATDGHEPALQATMQCFQCVRGVGQAMVTVVIAVPAARLFGVPGAVIGFAAGGLLPLVRGFTHLDTARFQKEMKFGRAVLVEVAPQVVATAVVLPALAVVSSYWLLIWIALLQCGVGVVLGHALANRPYRWACDRRYLRRIAAFGWPLVLNGMLLFAVNQGDRAIVGATYSLGDLALWSFALTVVATPVAVLARITTALALPMLSEVQHDHRSFVHRYELCAEIVALCGLVSAVPFILAGGPIMSLLFGAHYATGGAVAAWLAAAAAIRLLRVVPTLAAAARTDTVSSALGNSARACALLGGGLMAAMQADLKWIAACAVGGELAAGAVCMRRMVRRHGVPVSVVSRTAAAMMVGLASIGALGALTGGGTLAVLGAKVGASVVVGVLIVFAMSPELRREAAAVYRGFALAGR
jgi:O-antigen/teichoic acid export membrane protein